MPYNYGDPYDQSQSKAASHDQTLLKLAATRSGKAKHVATRTKRPAASKVLPATNAFAVPAKASGDRADSKQAQALALLRSTDGCTIEAIVKTMGWQKHSVRGFFAGVARRKLKLDLDSELVDKVRRYRIKSAADEVGKSAKTRLTDGAAKTNTSHHRCGLS
ncbi:DUF3489 domain-containing protein [Nitrobacter sp.]|uniref:DUF3489 domain-containing protein n=1 Tax=Nitrobacter sp. TaxID=29420 RepID=UPI003F64DAE7